MERIFTANYCIYVFFGAKSMHSIQIMIYWTIGKVTAQQISRGNSFIFPFLIRSCFCDIQRPQLIHYKFLKHFFMLRAVSRSSVRLAPKIPNNIIHVVFSL